jgi:DNA-directed RNA polymerase subunit M/transcription elongation factor TFIIS
MDMHMVKSCPRCGGIIYRYFSLYHGWREECFRCGYQNKAEEKSLESSLGQLEGSAESRK